MRHRSRVGQFSLLLVVGLLLAACGGDDGGGDEGGGEPIRIGALTSLTGNFTPWGVQVRDGMQLAVNEINQRGGVDGRQLIVKLLQLHLLLGRRRGDVGG